MKYQSHRNKIILNFKFTFYLAKIILKKIGNVLGMFVQPLL
jgi:hypothetical protein